MTFTEQYEDVSLGELVEQLTDDIRELASTQVQLAKAEMREEVDRAKRAGTMFGVAAIAGWMTLVLASFAAAWGLAEVMPPGWAFLIIAVIWGVIGGVAFQMARSRMRQVEPMPTTTRTMKEDVRWARTQMS